ncbi:MAG TPA: Glu-tRNA(Gln) amidotransferase subunit GatD [Candidatus Nanoarchaeia archaeon]|nr:Glu-tRNA(Gln) amidotransferase subunit GatD [Candidatus Nanoarchaeia archaeon]
MTIEVGDAVLVKRDNNTYHGVLMPSTTGTTVIKLISGYNAGFDPDNIKIELVGKKEESQAALVELPQYNPDLPNVSILSTGGTIASKVDYRTGAVTSQFTAEDIMLAIPELSEIANYNARVCYSILSENMQPDYWIHLAEEVYNEIKAGADGVIITHGTDTMMYTAAAIAFMVQTPVPIVFVGSQRSADRPSSDNAMNAICAAKVATSDIAEVTVVMHGTTSDDFCSIHRGARVRKMHTSRRDAFQTIDARILGKVDYQSREITTFLDYTRKGEQELAINTAIEPKCALIKFTTGASPETLLFASANYKGIVLEGTGLGHVSTEWIPYIQRATEAGIPVVMTSQCIHGRVCNRVYDTGRDILKAGAIEGEDMLPEVALVKLMWALGQTSDPDEVRKIMTTDIAGEITRSSRTW